jgi:hypothetical protein
MKFKVEYLFETNGNNNENHSGKPPTSDVLMSAVANPRLRFKPVFTFGMYNDYSNGDATSLGIANGNGNGGGKGSRPQIDFVVGGAITHPLTGRFSGCAGVFGTGAAPGSSVDVFSLGLGWNLGQTVTADSRGAFQATFEGIQPGIGLYGARRPMVMAEAAAQGVGEGYGEITAPSSQVEMALQLGRQVRF